MGKSLSIGLHLVGFSQTSKKKFASILSIAENHLDYSWKLVDRNDADFFLFEDVLQFEKESNLKSSRCIFYTNEKTNSQGHEIIVDRAKTPSLMSVIKLFNQLSEEYGQDLSKAAPNQQPVKTEIIEAATNKVEAISSVSIKQESHFFDVNSGILKYIRQKAKTGLVISLKNKTDITPLYVDLSDKKFYYRGKLEELQPLFLSENNILYKKIIVSELQDTSTKLKLVPQPINNLIWYAAIAGSQGKVIKGFNIDEIVQLKRWPDLNLPGCRRLIKLAAFMHGNAADLTTVHQKTGIPLDEIINFFNACYITGLIKKMPATDFHEKNLDKEKLDLVAKIGKRLKQFH